MTCALRLFVLCSAHMSKRLKRREPTEDDYDEDGSDDEDICDPRLEEAFDDLLKVVERVVEKGVTPASVCLAIKDFAMTLEQKQRVIAQGVTPPAPPPSPAEVKADKPRTPPLTVADAFRIRGGPPSVPREDLFGPRPKTAKAADPAAKPMDTS